MFPAKPLIWLGFIAFGLYTITILNTLRAYISQNATHKGAVYGIFYAGNAVSAALGVMMAGYIWEYNTSIGAVWFSFLGALVVGLANMIYTRTRTVKMIG